MLAVSLVSVFDVVFPLSGISALYVMTNLLKIAFESKKLKCTQKKNVDSGFEMYK